VSALPPGEARLRRGDSTAWLTSPVLLVDGMGVGLATAQLASAVLADVPVERSGQGSATQSTGRQMGSALGIAVLGTAFVADAARAAMTDGTALAARIAAAALAVGLLSSLRIRQGAVRPEDAPAPAVDPAA
jgi:hypothetical protein